MPRFEYSARDDAGNSTSGEIITNTRAEAAKLLRASGKFVVKLEQAEEKTTREALQRGGSRRIKQTQVIFFANQLAIMVDTGVPLSDALEATIMDEPESGFRRVVEDVIERVQSGQEFSAALAKHPRAFPRFFANIIKASEASGLLGAMLQRAAAYMTNQRETRKRIQGAMAYPLAMMSFCILVAIFLLTYLLPKFTQIFASRGATLPLPTRILMGTSGFLVQNAYFLVPAVLGACLGTWLFVRTPRGRIVTSWLRINLPIIGPMYRKAYTTVTMRTMGTMIDSGVSMLETVALTRNVVNNHYYEELMDKVDEQLRKGNLLSDCLRGSDLYPHSVIQMVLAGERGGQMGPVMSRVADFCEKDLNDAIKVATTLIEPALVVFMGVFIGGVVMALLLPIFSISKIVSSGP
ncbi:MAG: type II secretion system F family protein [Planctomycetes bacterium]|nr:type II secretion system F family protein [Planctomycetota bacterium]